MTGLYLHIPFCQRRCVYCDFYSTTFGAAERERYVGALSRELARRADEADGRRGAIGQKLYEGCLYAAHRTLPLPCVVRITNLSNGRSCKARVADRGPFINNRLIDVSSEVAHRLGFHSKGLDRVRVEVLSVGDGPWKRTR